jgi:phospholipid/cholesterol/gamma-HCH transport system permease protein
VEVLLKNNGVVLSESVLQIPQKIITGGVSLFGKWLIGFYGEMKTFAKFIKEVFHWMFRRPFRINLIFQQLEFVGNQSLNIILISGLAVGAVFGLQIGAVFQVFRAESLMGAATAKALCQELAPLVTAILLTGRAGSAMTAEISTMKVNEQVDAMEAMAVDPISYLVVPRFVAAILIIPLLCAVFIFVGVLGAYIAGVFLFNIDQGLFVEKMTMIVAPKDIWRGLIKSFAFSGIMASIACRYGLNARGGAKGVGIATTNSVVVTLLAILFVDVIITYFQIVW